MNFYWVYIISNNSLKPLYIGVTNDLSRRINDHKNKTSSSFSSKYNLNKLLWYEEFGNISEAISREKQLKNWHRQWKINLIKEYNPECIDLSKLV